MEDFGFEKIEISKDTTEETKTKKAGKPKSTQAVEGSRIPAILKVLLVVVSLLIILFGYIGVRAFAIYKDSREVTSQARKAVDALKKQNVVLVRNELIKTKKEIESFRGSVSSLSFLKFIPALNLYFNDVNHVLDASLHVVDAALIAVDSLIPYADVLGLKGEKSFVMGSAQDRIRITVKTLDHVVPKIDQIEKEVVAAKNEIDSINPSRYPNFFVFKKIRNQLAGIRSAVDNGVSMVEDGKPLISVLPELLAAHGEKKYLILFQNDKEQRPTGGFLTFYAIFRVEEGVINIDSSRDIYDLDNSIPVHPRADPIILKYLPKVSTANIRDSNLSPDFIESMEAFNALYDKTGLKTRIDGIIAIDTHFLVHALDILGEVQASGLKFHSKIDPRCRCPQAVYVLEENTTRPVGHVRTTRKAIIGDLLYATLQKALSSSPRLYWGKLAQQALKDVQEKHILVYLYNGGAQKGIESLNWAGRIRDFDGDYLHINDANFAGAKSNMYIKQNTRVDYNVGSDGAITKSVTIEYRNPQPHSDCNLERGGLCLNAVLRNFQRVYVPEGSELLESRGSEVKVETKEDLDKTYFESFFTVKPLGKSQIIYKYKLPFKQKSNALSVLIQKQPGLDSIPYEIFVNGKKVESFNLTSDKTLTIKL